MVASLKPLEFNRGSIVIEYNGERVTVGAELTFDPVGYVIRDRRPLFMADDQSRQIPADDRDVIITLLAALLREREYEVCYQSMER